VKGLTQQFRLVDAELVCPALRCCRLVVVDPEADHRHTVILSRMTGPGARLSAASSANVHTFRRLLERGADSTAMNSDGLGVEDVLDDRRPDTEAIRVMLDSRLS